MGRITTNARRNTNILIDARAKPKAKPTQSFTGPTTFKAPVATKSIPSAKTTPTHLSNSPAAKGAIVGVAQPPTKPPRIELLPQVKPAPGGFVLEGAPTAQPPKYTNYVDPEAAPAKPAPKPGPPAANVSSGNNTSGNNTNPVQGGFSGGALADSIHSVVTGRGLNGTSIALASNATTSYLVAHRMARPWETMQVSYTNPAGYNRYIYATPATGKDKYITLITSTAATVTYFMVVN
jgi:hypothetical protein